MLQSVQEEMQSRVSMVTTMKDLVKADREPRRG